MTKQEELQNKMYKLLKNQPYAVVRTEVNRIGRQLMELNTKVDSKEKN